ncbi:uncharacterized protein PGTG_11439 [Puccinia graminis f. sp. tritici CRL 75-36-700-3]|uniref:Fatty acid hydroxylase domain-containing protein n=1 Tax=Puccinia graminis f. sp. tritici (strain CRL 75-36-700-3 / race SCCL) TaxID=418459 RepID=E3KLS1_PUCGT|nr:uncharacterized protein PGTG_11439 [Puccinia graminis f. sp. tritici CRL 75-36-700-3]EFP85270.1 hypothetical protein PGTG_11439 [Puccinia graminis f. sp. tritici CRL 75-36-700-3]
MAFSFKIHDSELIVGHRLEDYINGPTHHTLHHLYFNCNFGQNPEVDDKSTLDLAQQKSTIRKNKEMVLEKDYQ